MRFYQDNHLRKANPSTEDVDVAQLILYALHKISINDILSELALNHEDWDFKAGEIPQYSSLKDCFRGVDCLVNSGLQNVPYVQMGFFLRTQPRKRGADTKYGENHAKIAAMMGLCCLDKAIQPNAFSYAYESLDVNVKTAIQPKLCLGIKLIRGFFLNGESLQFITDSIACLSESTRKRRLPNILYLIKTVKESSCYSRT